MRRMERSSWVFLHISFRLFSVKKTDLVRINGKIKKSNYFALILSDSEIDEF